MSRSRRFDPFGLLQKALEHRVSRPVHLAIVAVLAAVGLWIVGPKRELSGFDATLFGAAQIGYWGIGGTFVLLTIIARIRKRATVAAFLMALFAAPILFVVALFVFSPLFDRIERVISSPSR